MGNIGILITVAAVMFAVLGGITLLAYIYNLDDIKAKTVGDGQHGTARFLNRGEIKKIYKHVPFTPKKWREQAMNGQTPTVSRIIRKRIFKSKKPEKPEKPLPQGIVVGCTGGKHSTTAMVDTGDVHALMLGAAGVGKTAYWLYPCIEYACASGMSWLSTDTKGDIMRNYGRIAEEQYGYKISVIDLRNPTKSHGNNLLHLVNKYMDKYIEGGQLIDKAKAEKYAKIISKTIILSGSDSAAFGQNAYFYDAAEGLLTATILLVAEFCEPKKRHIVSVFKIIQELLAPTQKKGKNHFQQIMELLPDTHKAKWFAGAALNSAEQSMASVMSTALSRLNAFLDSELEQLLCFDTEIDAEQFCNEKCAIFVIMPEENPNTFFMISLIIQQMYREILAVADENGGKLKNRCIFFCDEFGTLPKIESAEMMFSASRSRRLQIVPIIQSFAQLEKNYGKEGAEIIVDNTQLTICGGFAPNSSSADVISKALGSKTVMSGSVSRSKNDPSQSLQMIERPLMTPDELKSLPKGQFIVIDDKTYSEAVRLKTERQKTHPTDSNEEIKMLKGYIVCGKCGSVMKRRIEKKCKYKERWYCINANCDNNVHIRDSIILKKIKTLLYRMTEDGFEPKERKMPSDDTKEIIRIKSELEQELIKPNGNSQHILDLCIELVGQQYGELKAVASIKAQLEGSETIAEFLSRYVDKILLYEDANATLITKNNIRIEEGG